MSGYLKIGWAEADITPERPALLSGMFHARLSEGVLDPLSATACVLESAEAKSVIVSCDLLAISEELRDRVRDKLGSAVGDELDPAVVLIHATHTHTGPETRFPSPLAAHTALGVGVELDYLPVETYVEFAAARIAEAIAEAWQKRKQAGIAYGIGDAVLGRNRRWVNQEGVSAKYGLVPPASEGFSHVEGYEDHSLQVLATYEPNGELAGLIVNVPCPSQLSESEFSVSADYWCETRRELRHRFGEHLYILAQCSAAGELCPFPLFESAAYERMRMLKGQTARQEIAMRIADEVCALLPPISQVIDYAPILRHRVVKLDLPVNPLTAADAASAGQEAEHLRAVYEKELGQLEQDPMRRQKRWYVAASAAYRQMHWNQNVVNRLEHQKRNRSLPVEIHLLRLGDIALASNPFELYVDYGIRIKVRSPAVQTFLVQLAGGGTYLPSPQSLQGGGYGSIPANNPAGTEAGKQLVDKTVQGLRELWDE
ncbi:neutral/alkaline non-lysosomal ceramidase N-terminal domain-containing protein [Paenibacillus oceani]|uniref:Neutral/alkaline non-lysosomal ceramidase N-terminal domain-containing protein n=1 Tax=Paenibacillus oceani TaxID=2772510 RepID=A0A927CE21_9BACL|nr:neutral/alkaline non-lysosomal ceramidase N-terminal domain-containing protein [Paenibacillus oceani]MBD2864892.1 neutral/alkaline non-lysosomal ceramidase N-terminal domain-containing protein [Paenibacillus oceani]